MPRLAEDFLSSNFEGSSFVWKNFKNNPALSILGSPLVLLDIALLPVRVFTSRESTDSDVARKLTHLKGQQGTSGSKKYAEYKGQVVRVYGDEVQPLSLPARKHTRRHSGPQPTKYDHKKANVKRESVLYSGWALPHGTRLERLRTNSLESSKNEGSDHPDNHHHRSRNASARGSRKRSQNKNRVDRHIDPTAGRGVITHSPKTSSLTSARSSKVPLQADDGHLQPPHSQYQYPPQIPAMQALQQPQFPSVGRPERQTPIDRTSQQLHHTPPQQVHDPSTRHGAQEDFPTSSARELSHQHPQSQPRRSSYRAPYVTSETSSMSRRDFADMQQGGSRSQAHCEKPKSSRAPRPKRPRKAIAASMSNSSSTHQVDQWLQGGSLGIDSPPSTVRTYPQFEHPRPEGSVAPGDSASQLESRLSKSRSRSERAVHVPDIRSSVRRSTNRPSTIAEVLEHERDHLASHQPRFDRSTTRRQISPSVRSPSITTVNTPNLRRTVDQRSTADSVMSPASSYRTSNILKVGNAPNSRGQSTRAPSAVPATHYTSSGQVVAPPGWRKGDNADDAEDKDASDESSSCQCSECDSDSASEDSHDDAAPHVPGVPSGYPQHGMPLANGSWAPAPPQQGNAQYLPNPQDAPQHEPFQEAPPAAQQQNVPSWEHRQPQRPTQPSMPALTPHPGMYHGQYPQQPPQGQGP